MVGTHLGQQKVIYHREDKKMEIKAILKNPYTEEEHMDFIVQYNHQLGYLINETQTEIQALGYTEDELEQQAKDQRNLEIDSKINELQIMALPEVLNGNIENIKLYNEVIDGLEKARP